MSAPAASLMRLQQKAVQADQLIALLKNQISSIQQSSASVSVKSQHEVLRHENACLRKEVELLKEKLRVLEIKNGVKQVALPNRASPAKICSVVQAFNSSVSAVPSQKDSEQLATENVKTKQEKRAAAKLEGTSGPTQDKTGQQAFGLTQAKSDGKTAGPSSAKAVKPQQAAGGGGAKKGEESENIDVSRLNMRIGFIVNAKKHPDADSLYIEEVDVGESRHRTIVSGLVKHVPIEQMQQRHAVFLLNLKPAKMRGVLSEGMIMCASTPDKVEIIEPPPGVVVGERVTVSDYPGPADDLLNPKKKIWEAIQPDLMINNEGFATYKGSLWTVEGKGNCKAPSMKDSPIK